jgi:hypothetical protein
MRIISFVIASALVVWGANSALAAKRHMHKPDTAVQKTEQDTAASPYAPGQQRFRKERHSHKSK